MKKFTLLISCLAFILSANVYAEGNGPGNPEMTFEEMCLKHEAPFTGINTMKDKCCIVANTADGAMFFGGEKDAVAITYTVNKNFALATCKVELPEDFVTTLSDTDIGLENGRTHVEGCHIGGIKHVSGSLGNSTGGFTIDIEDGTVSVNCKAER